VAHWLHAYSILKRVVANIFLPLPIPLLQSTPHLVDIHHCNLLMDKVSATFFGFMVLFVPLICTWLISLICISACRQMKSYQEDMCAFCGSIWGCLESVQQDAISICGHDLDCHGIGSCEMLGRAEGTRHIPIVATGRCVVRLCYLCGAECMSWRSWTSRGQVYSWAN